MLIASFPELKDTEVYNELEPWMIGQRVEVGIYEERADGDYGKRRMQLAGVLKSYGIATADRTFVTVEGGTKFDRMMWSNSGMTVLVSVVEPPE